MYAVIVTGGKQYRVEANQKLKVEKLDIKPGEDITFDHVLLVADGKDTKIGTPLVKGGKVVATALQHGRGKKIEVIKFKRRKGYQRKQGHRQDFTEIEIKSISASAA